MRYPRCSCSAALLRAPSARPPPRRREARPRRARRPTWACRAGPRRRSGTRSSWSASATGIRRNDPTPARHGRSVAARRAQGMGPTPWGHDWYAQEPWARRPGEDFYFTVQLRRYGGDLQGRARRAGRPAGAGRHGALPESDQRRPSLHKYDARNWRHIDRNFGPDPRGRRGADGRRGSGGSVHLGAHLRGQPLPEPGGRGASARHAGDRRLLVEPHGRGLLGVAGRARASGGLPLRRAGTRSSASTTRPRRTRASSPTADGRGCRSSPRSGRWAAPPGETHGAIDGTLVAPARDHIFNVTRRWLDPNGDGDPSDGVDGFRLDVAEMVPAGVLAGVPALRPLGEPRGLSGGRGVVEGVAGLDVRSGALAPG